jgi:rare lipoprotein A
MFLGACSSSSSGPRTAHVGGSGGGGEQGYYKVGKPYQINGVTYTPAFDPNYDETGIASWYAGEFTGEPTANGELYDPNQLTAAHRTLPMPSLVRVTNLDNGRALIVRINDRGPYAQNRIIDLSRRCAQLLGFQQKGTAKVRVQILAKESEALADAARHGELATTVADAIETNPTGAVSPAAVPPNTQVASAEPVQTQPLPPQSQPQSTYPQPTPLADETGGIGVVDEKAVITEETGSPAPKGQDVGGRFLPAPVVAHEAVGKTRIFIQAGAFASPENAARVRDRLAAQGAQVVPATVNGKTLYRVRIGPLQDVPTADQELNQVIGSGTPEAKIVVE